MALPMVLSRDWKTSWTHALVWVFALSWAFDFKADVDSQSHGGTVAQSAFLVMACLSGTGCMALQARRLLERPGVWLLLLWWGFLGFCVLTSLGQGVPPGNFVRMAVPYLMVGLGLGVAHAAAGAGLSPMQVVTPLVVAGSINIVWRLIYGFAFKGATLETARMEVFSAAMNPLVAYLGAAFMLRPRFHWVNLLVAGVVFAGVLVSVTRGLIFPMVMSAVLGLACFAAGLSWGVFHVRQILPKTAVAAGAVAFSLLMLAAVHMTAPTITNRWSERLFHQAGGGRTSTDLSWLTRQAEATAMIDILNKDPLHWINGRGMGASYYWDPSYWPELWTVYPADYDFSMDIWFNSHSVWTYALFSGGVVGFVFHVAFFAAAMMAGIAAVKANARRGRLHDQTWLGFLPVLTVGCLLSESFTSNQLAERLAGVMLGMSVGLPQSLYRWSGRAAAGRPSPADPTRIHSAGTVAAPSDTTHVR